MQQQQQKGFKNFFLVRSLSQGTDGNYENERNENLSCGWLNEVLPARNLVVFFLKQLQAENSCP